MWFVMITNVLGDFLVVGPPFHESEQFLDANSRLIAFFLIQLLAT